MKRPPPQTLFHVCPRQKMLFEGRCHPHLTIIAIIYNVHHINSIQTYLGRNRFAVLQSKLRKTDYFSSNYLNRHFTRCAYFNF